MIKKHILILLLKLKENYFEDQLNQIERINSEKELMDIQANYLKKILLHAYHNVPFYTQRLKKAGVVNDSNVDINEFSRIRLLTKDDIRKHGKELVSKDIGVRKWYYNSSGGSTGEPVRFIQDYLFGKWYRATLQHYYNNVIGIDELAVKKVMLSGSLKDIFEGTIGLRAKIENWLSNTKFLNSFTMTENDMERYVKIINSYKPDLIRGYASSLYEICKFIEKKRITVHQPKVVISISEKLRREMREKIETAFGAKVYDFYGSREVHSIAGECNAGLLHIFMFNNYVEVLNEHNHSVKEGEMGKIVVTTLHNYSMPLIRYEIGDTAILGPKRCKCCNPLLTLKEVTGRITDHFIKEDGTIICGEYFTLLFNLKDWIKSFQIIQEDYRKIRILVTLQGNINHAEKREIENKIKLVMGKNCNIIWEFVEEIPKTQSGKYLYIKSLLYNF